MLAELNNLLADLRKKRQQYKDEMPKLNPGEQYYAFFKGKIEALDYAINKIKTLQSKATLQPHE